MNASHAMTIRRRGKSWIAKLLSRRVPEPPRHEPVRMFIDDFGAAPLRQPIRDPRELQRR